MDNFLARANRETTNVTAITDGPRSLPHFDLDSYRDKNYLTHNLHPYPAKFVPQIPRILIEHFCPKAGLMLDMFCGSGTALLEAALLGRDAIGTDLHPLAILISKVKTTKLPTAEIRELRSFLSRLAIECLGEGFLEQELPIPEFTNRKKWFAVEAQRELAFLKHRIDYVENPRMRDVLTVCLSAVIVKASNQESDTRWKAIDKQRRRGDVFRFFVEKCEASFERLSALSAQMPSVRVRTEQANAKQLSFIDEASIDFVVTSPPYMNSYDYYLYHKLRMYWLGFDHYAVQEQEIGSRNKHCDDGHGLEYYENEMTQTMAEARRVLKSGAFAAYVIGDSILKGELITMDQCYRKMAESAGLKFVDQFSFDQRRYTKAFTGNFKSQTKQSHILLFRAN